MNEEFEKINTPKYTTQELRRIATTNFPIGFGAKEQALQYSADVIDAANDFIDELQAKIDAMEKRAEPSYPYPYAQSAHAAMSAEFGKALAQKLVSEPIDLAHRFLKKKLIDDPKADAVFRTVIEEDPMLRDAYAQNPVALERSFAAVRKMSPSVATLHGPVQSFLRHATVTGGTLDLAAIRQLAETQRFHQSAKQGN